MENKKYYIVTNKDMAITLKMLTRQEPYIYPNKFEKDQYVWSFRNDKVFQKTLTIVLNLIAENNNK